MGVCSPILCVKGECQPSRMTITTVKMPCWLLRAVETFARERGLNRSEVIRNAIIEFLAKQGYLSRFAPSVVQREGDSCCMEEEVEVVLVE